MIGVLLFLGGGMVDLYRIVELTHPTINGRGTVLLPDTPRDDFLELDVRAGQLEDPLAATDVRNVLECMEKLQQGLPRIERFYT